MSGEAFEDLDALLDTQLGNSAVAATVDPRERRRRDRRMSRPANLGRPSKGRHKQFNCKMREELHRQITQASRTTGIAIVDMAEAAFTAYLATLKGARHG
jgi:hypothetical protein